jgi:hypothetical protein
MEENLLFGKKHCVSCEGESNVKSATDILSRMWVDICGKDEALPMHHYRELVTGIDSMECIKMVNDFWTQNLGVSKEELLLTCPQTIPKNPVEIGEWDPNQKTDAEDIIKGRCVTCHRTTKTYEVNAMLFVTTGPNEYSGEPYKYQKKMGPIKLDSLDYSMTQEMLQSIRMQTMPKKEPLSAKDQKLVVDYLQKRMLDMDESNHNNYLSVRRYSEKNLEVERKNILAQIPGASEEEKQKTIVMVNCIYGQRDCSQYVANQKIIFEQEAASLPEDERLKFIEDKVMEVRCSNLMEVTPAQCQEWAKTRQSPEEK